MKKFLISNQLLWKEKNGECIIGLLLIFLHLLIFLFCSYQPEARMYAFGGFSIPMFVICVAAGYEGGQHYMAACFYYGIWFFLGVISTGITSH